jgi:hypothetical protein
MFAAITDTVPAECPNRRLISVVGNGCVSATTEDLLLPALDPNVVFSDIEGVNLNSERPRIHQVASFAEIEPEGAEYDPKYSKKKYRTGVLLAALSNFSLSSCPSSAGSSVSASATEAGCSFQKPTILHKGERT